VLRLPRAARAVRPGRLRSGLVRAEALGRRRRSVRIRLAGNDFTWRRLAVGFRIASQVAGAPQGRQLQLPHGLFFDLGFRILVDGPRQTISGSGVSEFPG